MEKVIYISIGKTAWFAYIYLKLQLKVLNYFNPTGQVLDREYVSQFDRLNIRYLEFKSGTKFEYDL
ncbi:hypothetical protein [Aliivibrio finisterrensis]|uniref:Uncharacterized protein n=1 Tax=Aliivibrio finisterrensis TaxID=511998 RepID=A0A6N6RP22_9GAMM|nr:hypothetical protein [Aliivibrio finisterrensis]KAB2823237.1 hypothetical protein F8B77_16485 [Aliivibrio finisterrensis]